MPKNNVTSFVNSHFVDVDYETYLTKTGFDQLRTYFGKVVKGQPKVYTAPFAGKDLISKVMSDWQKTLESIHDEWPSLWDFEMDLAQKVGPLSVQLPLRERLGDIAHYWDDILLPSKPIDDRAIDCVIKDFAPISGLRLRSQDQTLTKMKLSTNSGVPYWDSKRRNVISGTKPVEVWHSLSPAYHHQWIFMVEGSNRLETEATAVVGWRGQEGGPKEDDVKQRVVWMFPFGINLAELQFYQPFKEACQKLNLVPPWVSMDAVDERITALFDSKAKDDLIVCTDFSKFDQHFNPHLQDAAERVIRSLLTGGRTSERWLADVFPVKYYIPLLWEVNGSTDGYVSVFKGRHGMASGSGGTNDDETLTHRCLQHEAAILHGAQLNPNSMCLGDDGILSYPGITVDDVVETYESHGQECNTSKQYASTQDCVFLRRWHHTNYRIDGICAGVYSTMRAIGRLRYLERYMDPEIWSPKMVALRQLSIIENTKWHPLFEQFVEFCMKRDRYRLGIDIPGFLDNLPEEAKKAADYMPDFLGYTKTLQGWRPDGINDWSVVKYLKSHR